MAVTRVQVRADKARKEATMLWGERMTDNNLMVTEGLPGQFHKGNWWNSHAIA